MRPITRAAPRPGSRANAGWSRNSSLSDGDRRTSRGGRFLRSSSLCAATANSTMPDASAPAIRKIVWKSSARNSRRWSAKRRRSTMCRATSRGAQNSSSRSSSPKSNSAAGRTTIWCGRAHSRVCARDKPATDVVKEVEMPKAKAVKGAKAEAKKAKTTKAARSAAQHERSPTTDRKKSRACASRIPIGFSTRRRKSPSAM